MRPALLALAGLLAAGAAAAQERLVAQTADMVAVTEEATRCGEPVAVTIRASDPGFFEDWTRIQRVADGVRGVLTFECARIPRLDLVGETQGSGEPFFIGYAGDATDWLVETAAAPEGAEAPAGYAVAGLDLGMSETAALAALATEFAAPPEVSDGRIIATEGAPGPVNEPVPPLGARRLEALTSGEPIPLVTAVTLRQSVDGDQRGSIADSLIGRFGEPDLREEADGRLHMAWGRSLTGEPDERELEALIETRDGLTVLTLARRDPDEPGEPRIKVKF